MDALLSDIEAFLAANPGLSEWSFGEQALNDRHLIRQLRDGRELRSKTVERVRSFMGAWDSGEAHRPASGSSNDLAAQVLA